MGRRQGIFPQANFIKGLITETSLLGFPENACTETWNCVFNYNGEVTRRPGFDYESDYVFRTKDTTITDDKYQSFLWQTVGTQDNVSYAVQQTGKYLHFFKSNEILSLTRDTPFSTIDLDDYVPAGSTADPATVPCSFAEGRGALVVVSSAIDPLLIRYSASSDSLIITTINIKYRDFAGMEDGLGLNERITASVSSLINNNPSHYYNLLNQGWHLTDALTQWDTARTDVPSNADVVGYYRSSETDPFDNDRVDKMISAVLNTPAPKGHFILDAGSPSRTQALTDEGFTAVIDENTQEPIDLSSLTSITFGTITRATAAFDLNTSQSSGTATVVAANGSIGKTLAAGTRIKGVVIHTSTNGTSSGTIKVYGKTGGAPASGTDGTEIGEYIFSSSVSSKRSVFITVTDQVTQWEHVWIRATGNNQNLGELQIMKSSPTYFRPSVVSFYTGRIFYGGLPNEGNENSIYFSQIIERDAQYGQCYQKQDPTAEDLYDLLPDDGGVITIPEMGRLINLFNFQAGLIVIATNGVWVISGASRGGFTANEYTIRKISSISTSSRSSLVDFKGTPLWWAEDGIYALQYDPNFDSFQVASITDETIKAFIESIPLDQRILVKGAYDSDSDRVIWMITRDGGLSYLSFLCLDGRTRAFYPWVIETSSTSIKDLVYVRHPLGSNTPTVKFYTETDAGTGFTYGEFNNDTWYDWVSSGTPLDYESYFITAPAVHGDTQKFFQINNIFLFLEQETNASLWVQGIHDLTVSSDSNRWSTPQQAYRAGPSIDQYLKLRKLKIRGKGRTIQLKMYSETGKPFTCIGWSTNESVNEQI